MSSVEQVYEQIAAFAKQNGAKRVMLFGSRARGNASEKSDIDIAVEGCVNFHAFKEDVLERLHSLLSVDVVNLDEPVSGALRKSIEQDGKVLYEAIRPVL